MTNPFIITPSEEGWARHEASEDGASEEDNLKHQQAVTSHITRENLRLNKSIKSGLYRPGDAAILISKNGGGDEDEILAKLDTALDAKEINMFKHGEKQGNVSHAFEILWWELNNWIKREYSNIDFEFQTPKTMPIMKMNVAHISKSEQRVFETIEPKQQIESVIEKDIRRDIDGAPSLNNGKNSRKIIKTWIQWQAKQVFKLGDTNKMLAENILSLANRFNYESERGPLSIATIIKMIPPGLTGGRANNKGISKK